MNFNQKVVKQNYVLQNVQMNIQEHQNIKKKQKYMDKKVERYLQKINQDVVKMKYIFVNYVKNILEKIKLQITKHFLMDGIQMLLYII